MLKTMPFHLNLSQLNVNKKSRKNDFLKKNRLYFSLDSKPYILAKGTVIKAIIVRKN